MKKLYATIALMLPIAAGAFQPVPEPNCQDSTDVGAAKCKLLLTMTLAYNQSSGKMPDSIFTCAGTLDELFDHHPMHGAAHDSRVSICTQAALHLGVLQSIY